MSEKKTQFTSSWWIRRASYLVIGVVNFPGDLLHHLGCAGGAVAAGR